MKRHAWAPERRRLWRSESIGPIALVVFLGATLAISAGCNNQPSESVSADQKKDGGLLSRILPSPVTMPTGTNLSVRLLHSLSSRSAKSGAEFDAELAAPVVIEGKTLLSKGARVRGRVVSAKESGRLKDPGYLRLTLDAVQGADGKWVNIETTSVSAKGASHKKRNVTLIGGGAGTGAVIGAIAGGKKGAAIGAGVGAGAGTAGAYATGKKDVVLPAEAKLSFKTVREASVTS